MSSVSTISASRGHHDLAPTISRKSPHSTDSRINITMVLLNVVVFEKITLAPNSIPHFAVQQFPLTIHVVINDDSFNVINSIILQHPTALIFHSFISVYKRKHTFI
jgi:hypothetical protein